MATYPSFPRLSRRPALSTKGQYATDPTIRDPLENGMESTSVRFTRARREYTVTLENMTWPDVRKLRAFVEKKVLYGAGMFYFTDARDKKNTVQLLVRFSKLPMEDDEGWRNDQFRQKLTFDIRTV